VLSLSTEAGALWLLAMCAACALSVCRAATPKATGWALAVFVAVLASTSGFLLPWVPSAGEGAAVVGCACGWQLLRPGPRRQPLFAAGVCAALAAAVQWQQGAPPVVAVLLALLLVGSAIRSASRGTFAPPRMREQALTGLVLAAPVIGALPGVMSGWRSAVTINLVANARAAERFPDWVWQFVVAMVALGVLRQIWVRK